MTYEERLKKLEAEFMDVIRNASGPYAASSRIAALCLEKQAKAFKRGAQEFGGAYWYDADQFVDMILVELIKNGLIPTPEPPKPEPNNWKL